ncbi:hypothetical protein [Bradyrhizobium sp. RT5a]|uniref:hypothetical protein n=1 Tax=Bradyrhizobium sp. RT5a TaxID=3156380 RepID=UPI00339AA197
MDDLLDLLPKNIARDNRGCRWIDLLDDAFPQRSRHHEMGYRGFVAPWRQGH